MSRRRKLASLSAAAVLVAAALTPTAAEAAAPKPVTDPASLVNTLIGTSGAVNTFPGADMPVGMIQWSPDTSPHRTQGGGYEYNDSQLRGFSLTHISGPGCNAFGDLPILPTIGDIGANPGAATASFSHLNEVAQAGYYAVSLGSGVRTELTTTTRAGIGKFAFPRTSAANLLLKVRDSATPVDGATIEAVSDHEVVGSVTTGRFCGQSPQLENDYTLHFDIVFDHPFKKSGTWTSGTTAASKASAPVATGAAAKPFHAGAPAPRTSIPSRTAPLVHNAAAAPKAASGPAGLYLTWDATQTPTISARVGISFTSAKNASANLAAEIPRFNFDAVRKANHDAWNKYLSRIQISGGTLPQQEQFYTALYHALLHPNVFSDVNGEYMGFDNKVHTAAPGHAQYANYSGWDTYRSQTQLAAVVAPKETSDWVRSALNTYNESKQLPKWAMANGESYVMVGDPADGIIAGAYAFGARDFDTKSALNAMVTQATKASQIRPAQSTLDEKGFIPYDGQYGCCNFYGPVSTQQEYAAADYAIASFAKSLGDNATYTKLATRSQNWQNVFNVGSGYLQARSADGQLLPGFSPGTGSGFVEGTSAQYTPMIQHNLKGLIEAHGGNESWVTYLDSLLSDLPNPSATTADLSNEPSVEIPWEYAYAGAPWRTQKVVRDAQQQLYFDAPVGSFGNDDLGAMSSWYVWSELGFYPETPGTPVLVLGSPVFQKAVITLGNGKKVTINAPNAAVDAPYVNGVKINGKPTSKPWLDFASIAGGGTLDFDLSTMPNKTWGTNPADAPPSDATGQRGLFTAASPASNLIVQPGAQGTATLQATNITDKAQTVTWKANAPDGVTVSPISGTLTAGPHATAKQAVTVTAGTVEGRYPVSFSMTASDNLPVLPASVPVAVAKPGALWPYYTNVGRTTDGQKVGTSYDSSGFAYSANALAAAGAGPGATVTAGGVTFTMPDQPIGQPDNIESAGQSIAVNAPAGATKIGLIGSSTNAGQSGAVGTMTVKFTDGTTQQIDVGFSDWTLGASSFPPLPSNLTVASTPYRNNTDGGRQNITTYLFATAYNLTTGKTVASVTLPQASGGNLHVFTIGFGQ
ncbi:lectin [Fodinicola acaciae]|uniref:lectin n=1 Tax=Fodinicola acaciae TaxID=2681555 RepID=UPI0013D690AE|nr:lectin [Fodinicola acaciae]